MILFLRRSLGLLILLLTLAFVVFPLGKTSWYLLTDRGLRSAAPSTFTFSLHNSLSRRLPGYVDRRIAAAAAAGVEHRARPAFRGDGDLASAVAERRRGTGRQGTADGAVWLILGFELLFAVLLLRLSRFLVCPRRKAEAMPQQVSPGTAGPQTGSNGPLLPV
jgi:hypothetical protein